MYIAAERGSENASQLLANYDIYLVEDSESLSVVLRKYCGITNYPKTAHIYYVTFSVGQECKH